MTPLMSRPSLLLALLVLSCDGASPPGRACNVGADCASGVCLPDGRCAEPDAGVGGDDTGASAEGEGEGAPAADAGDGGPDDPGDAARPELDASPHGDTGGSQDDAGGPAPGTCLPDHDGRITAAELPIRPGFVAMFRVTREPEGFSSAPACDDDGCVWDLVELAGETADEESETEPVAGTWYADDPAFSDATFATRVGELDLSFVVEICRQEQVGVFRVDEDGLWQLGLVSAEEDGDTKLVFDPPVPVLKLPLEAGATWTTETRAKGPLCGSWLDYDIGFTYESAVDASGDLRTPYGTFGEVLRVNTLMRRHLGVGVLPTSLRTHTFVAECFSTVAAVMSEEGVDTPEFEGALEVRRLTNLP